MPSSTLPSNKRKRTGSAAAKKASARAAKPTKNSVAPRRAKSAANALEAKHRRASELLRQLRADVEILSSNADRLLSRFPS